MALRSRYAKKKRLPTIVIANGRRAGELPCSAARRAPFAYLVSIGAPDERPPAGMRNARSRIWLVFEDEVTEGRGGPTRQDVERLVRFARAVDPRRGAILVHCQAGISRSAAAAIIIPAVQLGPGNGRTAVESIIAGNPEADPNSRVLELGDEVLETGGRLLAALSDLRPLRAACYAAAMGTTRLGEPDGER